jgi:hypothetical protein
MPHNIFGVQLLVDWIAEGRIQLSIEAKVVDDTARMNRFLKLRNQK